MKKNDFRIIPSFILNVILAKMENSKNERYFTDDFIIKVVSGEATKDEINILNDRMSKDDELKQRYIQISKAWTVSSLYPHISKFNAYTAWEKITPAIKRSQRKEKENNKTLNKFLRIAATWILLFSLGGITSYVVFKNLSQSIFAEEFSSPIETTSPLGSRSFLLLPDKTKVWLNAGSKLIYHQNYGLQTREVELIGEGYFDVETNPEKPFIVHAKDLKVKAFGTSFNVKAYPEEESIETTLVEGKVTVEGKLKKQKDFVEKLAPNQKLTFIQEIEKTDIIKNSSAPIEIHEAESELEDIHKPTINVETNVQTEKYTSWKDDKWIIEGEFLDDLIVLLERRFNVDMELTDSKLRDYKFSGTIRRETIEQVMEILKYAAPISYKIDKSNITIHLDSKREKNYKSL